MTWMLKDPGGVEVLESPVPPNGFSNAVRLARRVVMTFVEVDENGAPTGEALHVYDEPYVHDTSDAGIARLVRDQQNQLNAIAGSPLGVVKDLSAIKLLVTPTPPTPPTEEEQAAADAEAAKRTGVVAARQKLDALKRGVELGAVKAEDPAIAEARAVLDAAYKSDPKLTLSVLG